MKIDRREALTVIGAAALAPATAATAQGKSGVALRGLLERSAQADAALHPLSGDESPPAASPPFVDPLGEGYARTLEYNKRTELAALGAVERAGLNAVDSTAYDVFTYRTRQIVETFDSGLFDVTRQANFDPSFGLHVEFPDLLAGTSLPFLSVNDYERGLVRLDGFADYLSSAIANSRRGRAAGNIQPRILIDNVLAQVDAMLGLPLQDTPFFAAIKRMPADFPANERRRLEAAYRTMIGTRILPGYRSWQDYLRDYRRSALESPGRWAMRDGARLYAAELARHTTTTLDADTIHQLGLAEVERIRGEMGGIRNQVGFKGDLPAFFEHVRTDPRYYFTKPEDLLARFKEIEGRIWAGIPRLFSERPRAPFEVRALPALGGQRGTGYYRPGPADGSSPGILFFNMAMLSTRPIPTMETLTLHEGIPGHHFQINLARENEALPPLLRFGSSTAFTEGWGLYSESLGRELGMFTDPMQWFGHLDMEMLRAVRLVVDTGIHAKRWDRQRGIEYMLANTSMAPRDVAVEIDRYIAAPGQACSYKIGEIKMHELRRRATAALGSRFDIREFHHQMLSTGALPLAVLDRKIGDWAKGRLS
ncbi:DUF885 domain-containing protein [Sphingomonas sp. SM33]|uniref:DUF885 domain-containing protein n=1 Tax=Sphingomonas telluris TaxID=2907998 RepID=A0ABS9VQB9_9SPHN|nr:DUF885 domain-containing protein [Sphingomonas telluris]MCH8617153.1 DUF885 domain-containing protein [Sphingomonas telluris]